MNIRKITITVLLIIAGVVILIFAGKPKVSEPECPDSPVEVISEPIVETKRDDCKMDIKFMGYEFKCSPQELPKEFARISPTDKYLSFDSINDNLTICGTTFHLNYDDNSRGFILFSSVQPEDMQLELVVKAISEFHGKETFEEDYHYSWRPHLVSTKIDQNYPIIHLRRVRSMEGGTTIIVR